MTEETGAYSMPSQDHGHERVPTGSMRFTVACWVLSWVFFASTVVAIDLTDGHFWARAGVNAVLFMLGARAIDAAWRLRRLSKAVERLDVLGEKIAALRAIERLGGNRG